MIKWFGLHRGFTLVELTILLAGGMVLILLAVPALATVERQWSLWGGACQVESTLQWGRLYAISANTSLRFEVDARGESFWWTDSETGAKFAATVRRLPKGVRINSAPAQPLRFFPRGNAAPAGSYAVGSSAGTWRIVVNLAGRIRMEKL